MTSRLRARMLAGVCALLVVVSSAGCQTVYPSSRPYTGIGATRNSAGDVIVLVRTCQGLAATKLQLSANGSLAWVLVSTGDTSPLIRFQVGQVVSGWTEDLPLVPQFDPREVYSITVRFSNDNIISSSIPFAKAEQGSVMTDAGRMTEDEFMRSPIRCGGPIVTDPHGPSSPSSRGGGQ